MIHFLDPITLVALSQIIELLIRTTSNHWLQKLGLVSQSLHDNAFYLHVHILF